MPTDEVMDLSTIRQCLTSLRAEEGRVSAWRAQLQVAIDGYGKGADELPEAFARDDPPRRGARATLRPVELHPLLQGDWRHRPPSGKPRRTSPRNVGCSIAPSMRSKT